MTRERMFGSDTEFCNWLRGCKELPSFSSDFGLSASDNDMTLHRYMTSVDGVGTREVQALMQIEVKTRQGKPSTSQMDTLSKLNMFSGQKQTPQGVVRFFGVFLLVLSGTSPDDSKNMWWGVIPKSLIISDASKVTWHPIDRKKLIQILRFDLHPIQLVSRPFRRRHKTQLIVELVQMPLGFETEQTTIKRS